VDRNQAEIVAALRAMGASVQILSAVGQGVPDLLIGYLRRNLLGEVKYGLAPPSQRKLTKDQVAWHRAWLGQVVILESVADAIALLHSVSNDTHNH
jgi:hypothetical protein